MKIAVFTSPESWHYGDLVRAAGERHDLAALDQARLLAGVGAAGLIIRCGDMSLLDFDAAIVRAMTPAGLEPVVLRMDALARLEAAGIPVINSAKAIEASIDKYLATAKLAAAGLLVPETIACQTVDDARVAFEELGGDVVVKPLFGGEGRGLVRVTDPVLALRAFTSLARFESAIYLQRFVPHEGRDWRLFVVGDEVLGMERTNPDDWRTNISRGGTGAPLVVSAELAESARRAAAAVGATVAGIDFLPGRDGRVYALEVNASPGWRALAAATGSDVAARVLAHVAAAGR